MRLSSTVVAVSHEGSPESAKGVVVTYARGGKLYRVRAKVAILCGQQHANRHICRDISPEYREAMNTFHHAPMLTVNVAVRNWKFLEKLGIASARWFEGFGWWVSLRRNLEIPGQVTQPLDPAKPTVLTMYNPFPLPGVPFRSSARWPAWNVQHELCADRSGGTRAIHKNVRRLRFRRPARHRGNHLQPLGTCLSSIRQASSSARTASPRQGVSQALQPAHFRSFRVEWRADVGNRGRGRRAGREAGAGSVLTADGRYRDAVRRWQRRRLMRRGSLLAPQATRCDADVRYAKAWRVALAPEARISLGLK